MENTEATGLTATAEQTSNLNLNNYIINADADGICTIPNEWIQSAPIPTLTTFSSSITDASSKFDEIKEHLKGSLEAVNNKINSILDLIKENDDFIDTYNNMLQYLIGQKQTIIDIQKLF